MACAQRAYERGELVLEARDDELPQVFRTLEVLEPMLAEVAQRDSLRKRVLNECLRDLREQHLAAMPGARDATRPMDVQADIRVR